MIYAYIDILSCSLPTCRFRRQFAAVRAAERKRREAAENLLHEGQQEQEPSVLQKFATFIATTLNEECASTRTSQSSKTGDSDSGTRPPLQLDLLYAWDLGMVAASF